MAQAFRSLSGERYQRLKQLEAENARLKKLIAERDLKIEVMKEVAAKKLVSVPARRRQVAYGRSAVSRRSGPARLFKVARSALSYQGARRPATRPWWSG
jgi:putative transposase